MKFLDRTYIKIMLKFQVLYVSLDFYYIEDIKTNQSRHQKSRNVHKIQP